MSEILLSLNCAMLVLDLVTISELRRFLLDFLRVKKSRKSTNRIYNTHPMKERITLSFIKDHLKKYLSEFTRYHKLYLAVIYTIIPQYIILSICNVLMGMKSIYVLGVFACFKLSISFIVRIHTDANRVSVYRKK